MELNVPTYLHSPHRSRERLLFYGPAGSHKTHNALQTYRACRGPGVCLHVIDFDNAAGPWLETEFSDLGLAGEWNTPMAEREWDDTYVEPDGTVFVYHCDTWDDYRIAVGLVLELAGIDDWLLIDSGTQLWAKATQWGVNKVMGVDLDEYLIDWMLKQKEAGKSGKEGQQALVSDGLYTPINAEWERYVNTLFTRPPCHLIVTAEAKELRSDGKDSKDIKVLYGDHGYKPDGQRSMGHKLRSVLLHTKGAMGQWWITTVKDWGREDENGETWDREEVEDFPGAYLKGLAGWKMKVAKKEKSDG